MAAKNHDPVPPLKHARDDHPPPAVVEGHAVLDPNAPRPTIGVDGQPIQDGEQDPGTIAEEQRRRSADMEREGVDNYMRSHRPRDEQQPAQVAGIAKPPEPDHEREAREHEEQERRRGRR